MNDATAALGYAFLLSVPVGVGVVLAFGVTTGRLSPLAVGAGATTALVIFALVLGGARGPEPTGDDGGRDP